MCVTVLTVGALYEKMVYDNSLLPAISTRIKIMGGMDISEKRKPQDGRMSVMEISVQLRVAVMANSICPRTVPTR